MDGKSERSVEEEEEPAKEQSFVETGFMGKLLQVFGHDLALVLEITVKVYLFQSNVPLRKPSQRLCKLNSLSNFFASLPQSSPVCACTAML